MRNYLLGVATPFIVYGLTYVAALISMVVTAHVDEWLDNRRSSR